MKFNKLFIFGLLLGLLAVGCTRPGSKPGIGVEQLNGNWVLERLQDKPLEAGQFSRGLPQLAFDVSQNRVTGHTGCNRLNGTVTVQGNHIAFSRLATTRMACVGASVEQPFLTILNDSTLTFKLKPGALTLLQENKPVLVFKKTE
jgi:heat shock protein HslJ